jgi:hypothetical protein
MKNYPISTPERDAYLRAAQERIRRELHPIPDTIATRILDFLQAHHGEFTTSQLAVAVRCSQMGAVTYLRKLHGQGKIKRAGSTSRGFRYSA